MLLFTALSWYCGLSSCFPHADRFPFRFPDYALFLPFQTFSREPLARSHLVYLVFRMCLFAYLESSVQCLSPFMTERGLTQAAIFVTCSQPLLTLMCHMSSVVSLSARRGTEALPSSRRTLKQDSAAVRSGGSHGPSPGPGLCEWAGELTQLPGGAWPGR